MSRTIYAKLTVDENRAIEEDMGTLSYLEREAGWMEESGIYLDEAFISDYDSTEVWDRYIDYVMAWAFKNSGVKTDEELKSFDKWLIGEIKTYIFVHLSDKEFDELWEEYKNPKNDIMSEQIVARVNREDVELYLALEKDFGNEYITLFTTIREDDEWHTKDFFDDETERNNNIKEALEKKDWLKIKEIMIDLLKDYCETNKF